MAIDRPPYSYRDDAAVPAFPDDKPIIIFDGHCVFCSGWARFVVRHDRRGRLRLLAAQSELGYALYRHFGLDPHDYQTNILIGDGVARTKSDGTLQMFALLDRPWSWVRVLRVLPSSFLDWGYAMLARNRLRLFGRSEVCFVPSPEIRERFLS